MKCIHCKLEISGAAEVLSPTAIIHKRCEPEFRRHQMGYFHDCPHCRTRGEVNDPSGRKTKDIRALGENETPACAFNGCWGCRWCSSRTKEIEVPAQVQCPLCEGVGYLRTKPKPITGVIGYELEKEKTT